MLHDDKPTAGAAVYPRFTCKDVDNYNNNT